MGVEAEGIARLASWNIGFTSRWEWKAYNLAMVECLPTLKPRFGIRMGSQKTPASSLFFAPLLQTAPFPLGFHAGAVEGLMHTHFSSQHILAGPSFALLSTRVPENGNYTHTHNGKIKTKRLPKEGEETGPKGQE